MEEKNNLLGYILCTPQEEDRVCCRELDDQRNINEYTYKNLLLSSYNFGSSLIENEVGEYIPLFLDTSYDFLRSFFGVLYAQKVCVPLHTIANEDAITHILRKVRAKSIIVTKPCLYKKLTQLDYVQEHIHTIFCSPDVLEQKALPCKHVDIFDIFNKQANVETASTSIQKVVDECNPDDLMQIVFTSGTTGEPKGAMLSHRNIVSCVVRAGNHLQISPTFRTLTFLPLSHVMAQNEVFIALTNRALVQIVGRDHLLYGLSNFQPNILVAVPRVYEAVYNGIQRKLRKKNFMRKLLHRCVDTYHKYRNASFFGKCYYGLFVHTVGNLVTSKVRKNIGQFKILLTAGAACPQHIYDFFEAIGMPLTNAQGLTEVSGAIVYNEPSKTHKGSIGYPLPGVEAKIAEDGEILFKGDPVFSGYFEEPDLNKLTLREGGWFKTGDLGRKEIINGKEYIFLLGRKKEILVLSSGLNIPPAQIEERILQSGQELIQQAMVVGDGEPRLGALIIPQSDHFNNPNIREEISKIIRRVNMQMDASEKINNFEIICEPFTIENGMLTPTMKIRRPVVFQRYKEVIGQLYSTTAV
ncbi:long-chain fatty acid--CoA ligase [Candidatus Uabimicrobium sp. HlEnr_7]|uniref:AMP-dependent synthetase/ligase n=1 Tax=Candidatus Uabimicrobium helgolandensis TaxID=3095367 RepID=UPI003558786C